MMLLFKTNFNACANNFIRWRTTSLVFNGCYSSEDGSIVFLISNQYYHRRMNMSIFGWYNNHEIDHSEGIALPEDYRNSGCRKSLVLRPPFTPLISESEFEEALNSLDSHLTGETK